MRTSSQIDAGSASNAALAVVWVLAMGMLAFVFVARAKGRREAAEVSDGFDPPDAFALSCRAFAESAGLMQREGEGRSCTPVGAASAISPGSWASPRAR